MYLTVHINPNIVTNSKTKKTRLHLNPDREQHQKKYKKILKSIKKYKKNIKKYKKGIKKYKEYKKYKKKVQKSIKIKL